jgi:hypothetical protein
VKERREVDRLGNEGGDGEVPDLDSHIDDIT